ncbi:FecR family protein [Magnetospirillum aberrantis]|uniref:FecR family protein n=1 Tax=Magnetospirillum aberrantis SpK TaxID=908842 RepID=A0A7C9UX23_9PROT|nr:FecR family protein [Magnetospirillum aberrantis]NFV78835.1 FecR family protein [Magnetospirillum aberrantis SpK]
MRVQTPLSAFPSGEDDAPLSPLTETALEWLVTLHSGEATETDWARYDAWKEAAPAHRQAADAAESLWAGLGTALPRRRPVVKVAAALSLAVLMAVGGLELRGAGPPQTWLADLRTDVGERGSFVLEDGSRIVLDTASGVDLVFSPERRRVILRGGAIHIQVSPDPDRPFEVEAAGGTVRALGTAFDVRRMDDLVRVVVTEHVVRVSYPAGAEAVADVPAGRQIAYGPSAGLGRAVAATAGATAWQRGRLVFDGLPLGEVVAEMGRYHRGMVVFADDGLRALPVTGMFDSGDLDGLLDAVAAVLPVRVYRLPGLAIVRSTS